jgi:hypothetical protein
MTMAKGPIRACVLCLLPAAVSVCWTNAAPAAETWRCAIDLHQGDKGTLELTRKAPFIEGKLTIERGDRSFESAVRGEWGEAEIRFSRTLSSTSYQPFQGTVTSAGSGEVLMEGRFAAGNAGQWSCRCQLVESDGAPAMGRRQPPRPAIEDSVAPGARGMRRVPVLPMPTPEPGVIIDFFASAAQAKWTNAWKVLPFPGSQGDSNGAALPLDKAMLEDGKEYLRVLEMQPHSQPHGMVVGRFPSVPIPTVGAELLATLGFLQGAKASDGVYFEVRAEFDGYHGIPIRREYHKPSDGHVAEGFRQDLSRLGGRTGTVVLSVNAGETSATQDWAVWVEPKLVSLEKEVRFASFVGGAVGSQRDGNRLLNAWGEFLYGDVMLYLLFANVDREYSLRIDSYYDGKSMGTTQLPPVKAGQTEVWVPLARTQKGRWRERIIFNGGYEGDIRYTISRM